MVLSVCRALAGRPGLRLGLQGPESAPRVMLLCRVSCGDRRRAPPPHHRLPAAAAAYPGAGHALGRPVMLLLDQRAPGLGLGPPLGHLGRRRALVKVFQALLVLVLLFTIGINIMFILDTSRRLQEEALRTGE